MLTRRVNAALHLVFFLQCFSRLPWTFIHESCKEPLRGLEPGVTWNLLQCRKFATPEQ